MTRVNTYEFEKYIERGRVGLKDEDIGVAKQGGAVRKALAGLIMG